MLKAISGICLSMVVIAGCSSGESTPAPAAPASPSQSGESTQSSGQSSAKSADSATLRAALLGAPKGMRIAYGPEIGAFGSLKSTKEGLEAVRQAKMERPECAGASQLDAAKPEIAKAPAAVISFAAGQNSITQAVVSLPTDAFPEALSKQCASYTANVSGTQVSYRTRTLAMPAKGDQSRAYITTATGGDQNAQIGSILIRRKNLITSMLVVGRQVKQKGMYELADLADQNLARVTR
ncbi:hypothetical protein ITP53_48495 [Nonomuraea sp. K274]|uniref:PknH-like protein n=1 Tax=Nonomuraea cypriaca TaxID=1187855 RepID=A0A931F570_9ACTN|nr:hypothetical protein [Nonomuraea cypriaca]MBF8193387.1 hypothetical protein [Nonomuraea cypriaca]